MNLKKISDKELITNIEQQNNNAMLAFKELQDRWLQNVFRRAYRMLRNIDDAEDVTQDVFLKIYRAIITKKISGDYPGRYIMRTTTNICINILRRNKIKNKVDTELKHRYITNKDKNLTNISKIINTFIDNLPPKHKALAILNFYERKTYKEIKEELNLKTRTISNHLAIIKKQLKEHLTKLEINIEDI